MPSNPLLLQASKTLFTILADHHRAALGVQDSCPPYLLLVHELLEFGDKLKAQSQGMDVVDSDEEGMESVQPSEEEHEEEEVVEEEEEEEEEEESTDEDEDEAVVPPKTHAEKEHEARIEKLRREMNGWRKGRRVSDFQEVRRYE